ncbi:hypothetical protein AcidC75_32530 [Acidisoma sp. C75]
MQALVGARDADALESLGAGAFAFHNLHGDAQRIAGLEFRDGAVGGEASDLLGLDGLDHVHRNFLS